ncbi:MAG: peroxiredoxin [Alphaproteobacteria bacterium]|jgi:peroxiredoxin|nr:peroxiredoxin [Alphaproteobacteria bacterium]
MTISVGDRMPSGTLMTMGDGGPEPVSTDEWFGGKKVVLFGLPGAFTPTCSAQHVPSYVENHSALAAKGVDAVGCMSVNDAFVMGAWGKDQQVGNNVTMLADGSAAYTQALGLELDLTARGMGVRCQRFAIVVDDGVVSALQIEENPGGIEMTGAQAILELL